jgi:AcrR family transcriptional regulator
MRADARRNYDKIIATARQAFVERDIDVPLDEIAKRAQVGAGTLYRHFPHRDALIEAVYRDEVMRLADRAYTLHEELPVDEALFAWIREEVRWLRDSAGLTTALKAAIEDKSLTFGLCRNELHTAVRLLLEPAQQAGTVRADLESGDLMRLAHGVGTAATNADDAAAERLLSVMLDGIRS